MHRRAVVNGKPVVGGTVNAPVDRSSARPLLVLVILLLLVSTRGLYAQPAIPSSDGTIHACYSKKRGALRVVPEGQTCRRSETLLTWKQKGAQGDQGAPGANGADGAAGAPGQPAT